MALNYTRHEGSVSDTGLNQTVPRLLIGGAIDGQELALDTPSDAIQGPCELRLNPDEHVTVDCRSTTLALNSAASPLHVRAGAVDWFSVPPGTWYIQATAA